MDRSVQLNIGREPAVSEDEQKETKLTKRDWRFEGLEN
jgi:hypothetical protein